ncbi:MAG: hypothetical protein KDD42_00695 [Bdellovibrionales bacterium]|nr:hypothetical protein [Bdellovibrionales bacterium]
MENDRDRMQNERLADRDQLEQASETFREKWEARNNSSFEDSFDQSALNVHFTDGASDNTTNITVSDGSDSVMLKVVNEGTLMDDWQIDAPNSLTKKELRRKISEALQGDQSNANTNKMAIQLLKPLGTSNMKG